MGRIQGLTDTLALTENQLLKTGKGFVFSITIGFVGVTAGHFVTLRDGTDGTGSALVVFPFVGANGVITKEWPNGKAFTNGLFYDEGAASDAVHVWTEITYK